MNAIITTPYIPYTYVCIVTFPHLQKCIEIMVGVHVYVKVLQWLNLNYASLSGAICLAIHAARSSM